MKFFPVIRKRYGLTLVFVAVTLSLQAQVWKKILPGSDNDKQSATQVLTHDQETAIIAQLRDDVRYLSGDQLGGRVTGTRGAEMAAVYVGKRMNADGLAAFMGNFKHPFRYVAGRDLTPETRMMVEREFIFVPEEAFPAPFSGTGEDQNYIMVDSREPNAPWIIPLYPSPQAANNPEFDWLSYTYGQAQAAVERGASSVVFYDAYGSKYAPKFHREATLDELPVPVLILSHKAYTDHFKLINRMTAFYVNIKFRDEYKKAMNIVGYVNNNAPLTVVIGAHFDGAGNQGTTTSRQEAFENANDNASGVAALLALAKLIHTAEDITKYNYMFIGFSGGNLGQSGAKAFLAQNELPASKIAYMLNLDQLGRLNATRNLYVNGSETARAWTTRLNSRVSRLRLIRESRRIPPSDYLPFIHDSVPALNFSTGGAAEGRGADPGWQQLNYSGLKDVVAYVYALIRTMEQAPRPAFDMQGGAADEEVASGQDPAGASSQLAGSVQRMGITIDTDYDEIGVRIAAVKPSQAASRAGLQPGDIILQLDRQRVMNIKGLAQIVETLQRGKQVVFKVKRGPTVQSFTLVY